MRRTILAAALAFVAVSFTVASQPGQPLDCSDWVILEPGVSCHELLECGLEPTTGNVNFPCQGISSAPIDAQGRELGFEHREPGAPFCGYGFGAPTFELKSFDGTTERLLASVNFRCVNQSIGCYDAIQGVGSFDAINGRYLVYFESRSRGCSPAYERHWMAAFEGFATLFEVLQTYTPQPAQLAFRVPAHPEGFRSADRFSTYWGRVSDLPDFTEAHPIACHYPATPPSAGQYITVADTSPLPQPGQANYVVTAVSYGAERRYGRQKLGPSMTGRDPALLPNCP